MFNIVLKLLFTVSVIAASFTHTIAADLNDETIYAIFDQANMADIATGRLGWKKAHAEEVRDLAKMVVTDHVAVQQMGRDLAKTKGWLGTPPDGDGAWKAQADALAQLDALSGREFDEAYLRYEIAYHSAVIDAINTALLPTVEDKEFQKLIKTVLPGFEHHLAMTKETADKLKVQYDK